MSEGGREREKSEREKERKSEKGNKRERILLFDEIHLNLFLWDRQNDFGLSPVCS